jgi:beta-lactamase regulating signal transducer with metallopeptidase domain
MTGQLVTDWLVRTLVTTGALMGAVLLVRRAMGRLFGPGIAYALWALPLIRLVLPPLVLPASLRPESGAGGMASFAPLPVGSGLALDPTVAPGHAFPWALALLLVWLAGAIAFLVLRAHGYTAMRRGLLRDARPMGEIGTVRIVESPAVDSPLAFGIRDRVVALPLGFLFRTDPAARELAIAHEFEHHAAHDLAVNFAFQLLLALHWFDPVAWLAWRAMRQDQEAACDARVLAGRGREERLQYGTLIASLAAGPRRPLAAPMAAGASGRPLFGHRVFGQGMLGQRAIVHRLRRITAAEPTPQRRVAGAAALALGVLALPLTASISYAAHEPDEASASARRAIRQSNPARDDRLAFATGRPATQRSGWRGNRIDEFGTGKPPKDTDFEMRIARSDGAPTESPVPPQPPGPGHVVAPVTPALPAALPVPPVPPTPALRKISYSSVADPNSDDAGSRIVGADGRPDGRAMTQLSDCIRRQVAEALREAGIARREALRDARLEQREARDDAADARREALEAQADARESIRQARTEVDQEEGLSQSVRDTVNKALDTAVAAIGDHG